MFHFQSKKTLHKPLLVRRVHDVDEAVCAVHVVLPVCADRLLPTDVPHVELHAVVVQGLDVEPLGGRCLRDVLIGETLHDGGLTCVVKAEDEDTRLLLAVDGKVEGGRWWVWCMGRVK